MYVTPSVIAIHSSDRLFAQIEISLSHYATQPNEQGHSYEPYLWMEAVVGCLLRVEKARWSS